MICARCEHFTLKDDSAQAERGRGHCVGFLASAMDFVDWNDTTCGLYRPAKKAAQREQWIAMRGAKLPETTGVT